MLFKVLFRSVFNYCSISYASIAWMSETSLQIIGTNHQTTPHTIVHTVLTCRTACPTFTYDLLYTNLKLSHIPHVPLILILYNNP